MKNQNHQPTASKFSILRQLGNLIPPHRVPQLARDTGAQDHARTFSPWSQVVSLLYAQLTRALGLNDVCDALRLRSGPLSALHGATPPAKNTFSHANRTRDPKMAEQLFWAMLNHLQTLQPGLAGRHTPRFAFRFKRLIHVVATTPIALMAGSLHWTKPRRHCVDRLQRPAAEHDNVRARELCANIQAGEIVVFDKAYVDFAHLADLSQREIFFVTRAKDNLPFRLIRGRVGTALLAYLLLPFCAWLGRWSHGFTCLFALLRSALWQKLDLRSLLENCGTAGALKPKILKPISHCTIRFPGKSAAVGRGFNPYWPVLKCFH